VRANGTIIGTTFTSNQLFIFNSFWVSFPTNTKIANLSLTSNGRVSSVGGTAVYPVADCVGTPYIGWPTSLSYIPVAPEKPVPVDVAGSLYYVPATATTSYTFAALSFRNGDSCVNSALGAIMAFALLPNDSTVTGISVYPFPTPITIDGMTQLPTTAP
jgi:hypothetical protein